MKKYFLISFLMIYLLSFSACDDCVSYTWNIGADEDEGETEHEFGSEDCDDDSEDSITYGQGSNKDNKPKSQIYPIPFVDELNIKINNSTGETIAIDIYNSNGFLLISRKAPIIDGVATIRSLDNLNNGVYYIKYIIEGNEYRHKVNK